MQERACVPSEHTPLRFFITRRRLPSLAEIQGVSQVLVWDGRWRGKQGKGGEADLLVTITIELLYKAPVDNIGGITEQERQSSFIKKRPCWRWRETKATHNLCELSLSGGRRGGPPTSLGFINLCIYFFACVLCRLEQSTHSWQHHEYACTLTDVSETLIVMEEGCKMYLLMLHNGEGLEVLFPPDFVPLLTHFFGILSALFCLKAEAKLC